METVSPNIFTNDIGGTIVFYQQLGFELTVTVPEQGDPIWAMMKNGSVTFMFQTYESLGEEMPDINKKDGGSLLLYIQMKGIRAFFESVKDKVPILKGLEKMFYGATEFSIRDNNGFVLTFAEDE